MESHDYNIIITFYLDANSVEHVIHQRCLIFVLWNG